MLGFFLVPSTLTALSRAAAVGKRSVEEERKADASLVSLSCCVVSVHSIDAGAGISSRSRAPARRAWALKASSRREKGEKPGHLLHCSAASFFLLPSLSPSLRRRRFLLSLSLPLCSRRQKPNLPRRRPCGSRGSRAGRTGTRPRRASRSRGALCMLVFEENGKTAEVSPMSSMPPLLILFCLLPSRPRATPFRRAHSRSLVPLVLLARSPNAGTAAIFGWWSGEKEGEGERGTRRQRKKGCVMALSPRFFLSTFILLVSSLSRCSSSRSFLLSISLLCLGALRIDSIGREEEEDKRRGQERERT